MALSKSILQNQLRVASVVTVCNLTWLWKVQYFLFWQQPTQNMTNIEVATNAFAQDYLMYEMCYQQIYIKKYLHSNLHAQDHTIRKQTRQSN